MSSGFMHHRTNVSLFLLLLPMLAAAPTPAQRELLDVELTIVGRTERPTVYLTPADIARARKNRDKPWASGIAQKLLADADKWVGRADDEIVALVPPPGACFAYGFSGCPNCDSKMGWWGVGNASLDDPGHIHLPQRPPAPQ